MAVCTCSMNHVIDGTCPRHDDDRVTLTITYTPGPADSDYMVTALRYLATLTETMEADGAVTGAGKVDLHSPPATT